MSKLGQVKDFKFNVKKGAFWSSTISKISWASFQDHNSGLVGKLGAWVPFYESTSFFESVPKAFKYNNWFSIPWVILFILIITLPWRDQVDWENFFLWKRNENCEGNGQPVFNISITSSNVPSGVWLIRNRFN